MLTIQHRQEVKGRNCPHCGGGHVIWDQHDREPFCFNCGWRISITITPEEALTRRKWITRAGVIVPLGSRDGLDRPARPDNREIKESPDHGDQ